MCILSVRWSVYTRMYSVSFHLCKRGDVPNYAKSSLAQHIDSRSFLKFTRYLRKPISGNSQEIIFYIFNQFIVVYVVSKVADSEIFEIMSIGINRRTQFNEYSKNIGRNYYIYFSLNLILIKVFQADESSVSELFSAFPRF